MTDNGERLHGLFLEVVDNQIREGKPAATKQTFERLQREGNSPAEAKRLIACVVAAEMFEISKEKRGFNEKGFVQRLEQLPDMPWSDDA